ncbi:MULTISPECIES: DUF6236 family protein [Citrobacter]|uniref:DUF6236 family protein n=1 Tax=Citrobacter TaxID=544 RepID=UPI000B8EC2C0|nr:MULTISPECIES: DUF6236 family protein [Citrobacter]MBA8129416.1 hypothetical protein [Citrobacter sp. RHBSTW-00013]MDM3414179.1 DUF6236 family protein [Citrobacter sp. Cb018]QLZ41890.1 hypothetical protein HV084_14410 [Citrobacter sp. RHBSTW-00127]
MKRGVVFSVCELVTINDGQGFRTDKWINPLDLNYLLLYWDKLVSPTNNFFHFGLKNEDELIGCGLLKRPVFRREYISDGEQMSDFYAETHAKTIDILRHQEGDVDWRMHFLNEQINLQPELARSSEVLRFELANLLPVPPEDVHLHEILEFKERRKAELTALHEYLDELYLEVKRSGDINLQRATALSSLKKAILDIDKLNHEVWRSPIKFSMSTSFEFDLTQLYGALTGAILALNVPPPYNIMSGLGSAISVLGGCIKINPQLQSVLSTGDRRLAYVSKGKAEGIML